jgi:hypothetical protein
VTFGSWFVSVAVYLFCAEQRSQKAKGAHLPTLAPGPEFLFNFSKWQKALFGVKGLDANSREFSS